MGTHRIFIVVVVLLVLLANVQAQTPAVDLYLDMEAGSIGSALTTATLTAATHGAGGTWSLSSNAAANARVTGDEAPLHTQVRVGNTVYTDSGHTRGIAFPVNAPNTSANFAFASSRSAVSMGAYMTFGSNGSSFQTIDHLYFDAGDGSFCVAQTSSSFRLRAHSGANGGSSVGPDIPIAANHRYWITMKFQIGLCSLQLFDATTRELVGQSSIRINSSSPMRRFRFGRTDSHDGTNPPASSLNRFDDLVLDWTTAAFPLLNPTGAPPSSSEVPSVPTNLRIVTQ
jgi:hypothetical protein